MKRIPINMLNVNRLLETARVKKDMMTYNLQ